MTQPTAIQPAQGPAQAVGADSLPHDIYGIVHYSTPWYVYAALAIGGIALLLALYAGFKAWKRRAQRTAAPVDPWQALKDRVAGLQIASPFTRKAQEDFFYELSLALRDAIERRCGIPATSLTHRELKQIMRSDAPLPTQTMQAMLAFLQRADLVKFADAGTDVPEAEAARREVLAWIDELHAKPEAQVVPPLPYDPPALKGAAKGGSPMPFDAKTFDAKNIFERSQS